METKKILVRSFANVLAMSAYIFGVAWIMNNGERLFGKVDHTLWAPFVFLSLFVLSAAVTSLLFLGKPVLLYMDGAKKDAVAMVLYSIGWLALFVVLAALVILV